MRGDQTLVADRELRQLLRTGTFAQVLDHALNVRGLSLERVQRHLAAHGVTVSRAALSYWRHGRSRPERAESLRAVRLLENVLELPAASLMSRLGPPRSRGAHAEPGTVDRRRLWPAHSRLLAELDAPPDSQLRQLDIHEHVQLNEKRQLAEVRTRLVLQALADRVDRCVVYHWNEEPVLPVITDVRYCRLGRVRTNTAAGATVSELLFDQRLSAGECAVVEYVTAYSPGDDELTYYHRRFTRPVRQFLLQVGFAGAAPASCVPYRQTALDAPRRTGGRLWIGASNTAHLVVTDAGPGIIGLTWDWD
ncbi:XRE family transcriptional regulator [Fodinicola acaciae]|uniref:XRE family transcriptional regulator n=1 Tax=Fodinicola acaciae TaxID=2681555 RepID=UPI0013D303A1|nr:XRE family transcriptional regulator [Fodinicola acaciae]